MFLARQGIKSVIVEKQQFPRYHIGESMSGECGGLVRTLGLEPEMVRRKFPVKRGVNVYGPAGSYLWRVDVAARDKDWKLTPQSTWQVHRQEFDKLLLDTALARGGELVPGEAMRPLVSDDDAVRGVAVHVADGGIVEIESDIILDCSGQQTFLAKSGVTGSKYSGNYDKQAVRFPRRFCGKGYICVGDAHRFIDPIVSFGLYISVFEAMRAASIVRDYLNDKGRDDTNPFADHQLAMERGIDILEDLMDTFLEYPLPFARMALLRLRGFIGQLAIP